MPERLKMGLIGCGGMCGAHIGGYRNLWKADLKLFDIVAACDIEEGRAQTRANEAHEFQGGTKPAVYKDVETMLDKHPDLDCVDICTLHRAHHTTAVPCLEADKHVIIEKPMAITMRACRVMLNAAEKSGKVLSVAENYRLSPHERARRWAIQQGRIGDLRMIFWIDVGEGLGKWGWRNFKADAGGGWTLDGGVHFADLMRFSTGLEAEELYAVSKAYEPYRYDNPAKREGGYKVTVEDATISVIKFENGVTGQWTWVGSAPGQGFGRRTFYGSEGCIDLSGGLFPRGGENVNNDALYNEFIQSISEEEKEYYFPRGVTDTVAIELKYFADAIHAGGKPMVAEVAKTSGESVRHFPPHDFVDGIEGMKSQAICMAVFESSWHGRAVTLKEIENCELEGYQKEINDSLGL